MKFMIIRNIINYPILVYIIYYALIIIIQIIFSYNIPIEDITYTNNLIRTLPSINIISDYFSYKNIYLYETNNIYTSLLKKITISTQLDIKDILTHSENYSKVLSNDYIPSEDEASYIPSDNIYMNQNHNPQEECIIDTITIYDSNDIPTFKIEECTLEPTIVKPPDIINNDLPFETPVEIKVDSNHKELVPYDIHIISSKKDMLNSICSPSFEGPIIHHNANIHQLHLDILNIVKQELSLSYNREENILKVIRDTVHDHFLKYNMSANITTQNLQNTNHLINLLVQEMIINSIFTYEDESFILQQIAIAITVETLSILQNIDSQTYYNNPDLLNMVVNDIISRFLRGRT